MMNDSCDTAAAKRKQQQRVRENIAYNFGFFLA